MKFKKTLLAIGLICSTILTACDFDNSLYNKTYTYKNDCYLNTSKTWSTTGKSLEEMITEQIAANNINWDSSGAVSDGFFISSITPFAARDTSGIIKEIKQECVEVFDKKYKDLKIVTSSTADRKCTITYDGKTTEYTAKPYSTNGDDSPFLYLYNEIDTQVGEIAVAINAGAGITNGVVDCLEICLDCYSRVKFTLTFINEAYSSPGINFYCNALIKN